MRSIDIIRQKRRFYMFNEKSKDTVLEINSFFGKYKMHFEDKIKKTFTYYDTPNFDLYKSNIILFKTHIGNFVELNMATEKTSSTARYNMRINNKHFSKQIKPLDNLLKHKDFLIDNFTNMFFSSLNFDPEFLMRKLQPVYEIKTVSTEYRSINATGLKITYSFDKDIYTNIIDKQVNTANILTIYQHSPTNTDEEFEDLIGKLTRYCKELTPTNETKIQIARKYTVQKAVDPIAVAPKNKKSKDKRK